MGAVQCVYGPLHAQIRRFTLTEQRHTPPTPPPLHASHLATASKNITPEKGGKIPALCGGGAERERERDEGVTDQTPSPTTQRQVCSGVFAVQPPTPNTLTHTHTHTLCSHATCCSHLLHNTCPLYMSGVVEG